MTKFLLMFVSVLAANLLANICSRFVIAQMRAEFSPVTATAITMVVLVVVLVPLYSYLDGWATTLSKFLMRTGAKFLGRRIGFFVMFLALLAMLFYAYGKLWFKVNVYTLIITEYL